MYKLENNPETFISMDSLISYVLDKGIDPSTNIFTIDDDLMGQVEDYIVL